MIEPIEPDDTKDLDISDEDKTEPTGTLGLTDAPAPEAAPYDSSWTLDPKALEGVSGNQQLIDGLVDIAKKYELPADKTAAMLKDALTLSGQQDAEGMKAQRDEWRRAAMNDREIGGSNFNENLSIAKKALDVYGSPEIRELLASGWGDNPDVIKFFYRVGKSLSEDSVVSGGMSGNSVRTFEDAAKLIYGK